MAHPRTMKSTLTAWLLGTCGALALTFPGHATMSELGGLKLLPGDQQIGPAIQDQNQARLAPGGPGYLAVWTDKRAVLDGQVNAPGSKLSGNMLDIYGQLLDTQGNPVGPPIIVCSAGRNQRRPAVAWNGSAWLVAFEGDRPDWYFDRNIYGVRISAQGAVLDSDPILLFEHTAGQGAYYPAVASDGEHWLVICDQWFGSPLQRTVRGRRVATDGTLVEAQPVSMIQSSNLTQPDVAFASAAGGVYMVAIKSASNDVIYVRRFSPALAPLDALTALGPGWWTSQAAVASNGIRFMVVGERAHRVEANGQVLDPAGITLAFSNYRDVAWTGASWAIAGRLPDPPEIGVQRIADDGTVIDAAPIAVASFQNQDRVSVAGSGAGDAQIAFTSREHVFDDVSSFRLGAGGAVTAHQVVSVGLPRQAHVRMVRGPGVHMAVFGSTSKDRTSVLAQRLSENGAPIDLEPIVVEADVPVAWLKPDVAWNGEVYLVVWTRDGSAVGKRLSADGVVLDPQPITILDYPSIPGHTSGAGAVAAAGATFVVSGFHYIGFHQPVRYVEMARVSTAGAVLDQTPILVVGGFVREMAAASFGDRAIVVWGQFGTHDSPSAYAQSAIIDGAGTITGPFAVSQSGRGKHPSVAVSPEPGGAALVVWHDDATIHQDDVEGRFVMPDGTMPSGEFLISGAPNQQMFPAVAWDGEQYLVAWNDYRHVSGLEQSRADIFAARVLADGSVLDPSGIAVADDVLPEDLAGLSGGGGRAIIIFSALHGLAGVPEIQRLAYRVHGDPFGSTGTPYCFGDGSGAPCPCANTGAVGHGCASSTSASGAQLSASGDASIGADTVVLRGQSATPTTTCLFFQGDDRMGGGLGVAFGDGLRCAGTNVVRLQTVQTDSLGEALTTLPLAATGGVQPGETKRYQLWYRDPVNSPCGTTFNLSNGLEIAWTP